MCTDQESNSGHLLVHGMMPNPLSNTSWAETHSMWSVPAHQTLKKSAQKLNPLTGANNTCLPVKGTQILVCLPIAGAFCFLSGETWLPKAMPSRVCALSSMGSEHRTVKLYGKGLTSALEEHRAFPPEVFIQLQWEERGGGAPVADL